MQNTVEILLLGLSGIVLTLLACWGWWEVRHWWLTRDHRRYRARTARSLASPEDDQP